MPSKNSWLMAARQQDAISKAAEIRKISYDGVAFNTITKQQIIQSGTNQGKAATLWSKSVCEQSANSFYGKKPQIELYSRKELYVIIDCIEDCLVWTRACQFPNEARLIADIIFATICNAFTHHELSILKSHFRKKKASYG
jgi:hypothetical protein